MSEAAIELRWPQQDVDALMGQIDRAMKELGKDEKQALQWAGYFVSRSLAASTKVSSKKRPIVRNPDKRWKTDKRRAPFGVMRYHEGQKIFQPIYKTGEFGSQRFFDKKTVAWYDRSGGSGNWKKIDSGPDPANPETIVPGIKTDRRRDIRRSGFAKKSWQWAQKNTKSGGSGRIMDIPDIVQIAWSNPGDETVLKITNNVRYMRGALRNGRQAVDTAMDRAMSAMRNRINDALKKKAAKAAKGTGR